MMSQSGKGTGRAAGRCPARTAPTSKRFTARRGTPGLAAVAAIAAGVVGGATVAHGQVAGPQKAGPDRAGPGRAGTAVQASPTPSPRPSERGSSHRLAVQRSRPLTQEARDRLLAEAKRLKGTRYRYGGDTPRTGFDCSGFARYVYAEVDRKLPRTARAQYDAAAVISRAHARPGDLVFFHQRGSVYHVAVYAGGGKVWQSPKPGDAVELEGIWTDDVTFGRF
ncbi:MAG: C40 family peptidase [Streptomycetales bacterium]